MISQILLRLTLQSFLWMPRNKTELNGTSYGPNLEHLRFGSLFFFYQWSKLSIMNVQPDYSQDLIFLLLSILVGVLVKGAPCWNLRTFGPSN